MESRHCLTGQKSILLSCPQCLDSMPAPGFWNKVYGGVNINTLTSFLAMGFSDEMK